MPVGQLVLCLKNGAWDFSEVLREVRGPQGSKTDKNEFFRKILISGKNPKIQSK